MKLTFLGTRGEIEASSDRHRRHSSLRVAYRGRGVVIDCGTDWRGGLAELAPRAVVLTHAHPDHAGGLADGAPCPVYATAPAWRGIERFPIEERCTVEPRRSFRIGEIEFVAFPLLHSLRAPAVGYRVRAGEVTIFYAPDVLEIEDREAALAGIDTYVGDGAHLTRPIVRGRNGSRVGHASVRTQLDWCAEAGVPRVIVTHCGSQIVAGDARRVAARLRQMALERGLSAKIARDGMEVLLRRRPGSLRSRRTPLTPGDRPIPGSRLPAPGATARSPRPPGGRSPA